MLKIHLFANVFQRSLLTPTRLFWTVLILLNGFHSLVISFRYLYFWVVR